MTPPSAFDSSVTPADMAIIAPDSTRTGSPPLSVSRATPYAGVWRVAISMRSTLPADRGRYLVDSAAPTIAWAAARRAIGTRNGEQLT